MWMRLALLVLCTTPALAEGPIAEMICVPRPELERKLSGSTVAAAGLRDRETVLEIWTRPSGQWTLVQSYADGIACILAMGEAWETMIPPPA